MSKQLRDCFWAVVEVDDKNHVIYCPLIDNMGCEECMEAWEEHLKWEEQHENQGVNDAG